MYIYLWKSKVRMKCKSDPPSIFSFGITRVNKVWALYCSKRIWTYSRSHILYHEFIFKFRLNSLCHPNLIFPCSWTSMIPKSNYFKYMIISLNYNIYTYIGIIEIKSSLSLKLYANFWNLSPCLYWHSFAFMIIKYIFCITNTIQPKAIYWKSFRVHKFF